MGLEALGKAAASAIKNVASTAMKAAITAATTAVKAQLPPVISALIPNVPMPKKATSAKPKPSPASPSSIPYSAAAPTNSAVQDAYYAPSNWQIKTPGPSNDCPPPPPPPCGEATPQPAPSPPAPAPAPAPPPKPPASTTPAPPAKPQAPQAPGPAKPAGNPFKLDAPTLGQRNANGVMQTINPAFGGLISSLPGMAAENALGTLFNSDKGQSVSLKLFHDKGFFKLKTKNPLPNGSEANTHGWLAEKGEVTVSNSWLTENKTRMRTGTFTLSGSLQVEVVPKTSVAGAPVKALFTGNLQGNMQYSITTGEDRLEAIMTGKEKAPDPFTLENMKVGDSVSVSMGNSKAAEAEFRAALFKAVPGLGVDFKLDKTFSTTAQKFTVKMVANPSDASRPHVLVMEGDRKGENQSVGFGLIWDSTMAGKAPPAAGEKGPPSGFARALFQAKEGQEVEHFNFVELDPADTSKGGGRDLFNRIMNTGVVADPQASDKIPGSYAYGTLDVDTKTSSATLQLSGFLDPKRASSQALGQYSIDLLSSIDTTSKTNVIEGKPGAVSGGTGTFEVAARYSEGGFTNYIHSYKVDPTKREAKENMYLTSESTRKDTLVRGLETGAFQTVNLHMKDGSVLTGKDAIEWLKTHEDKSDGWWFLDGEDKVSAVMNMGVPQDANSFSRRFLDDQKKYHDDQQKGFLNNLFYEMGQSQKMSQESMIAYLTAPDLMADPDHPLNLGDHQKAGNADENFKAMSGSGLANLVDSAADYWKHSGAKEPYPVTIDIIVDYQ